MNEQREGHDDQLRQFKDLLMGKQLEQAEKYLRQLSKSNHVFICLTDAYKKMQFDHEEEYEQFLLIVAMAVSPETDPGLYQELVVLILQQIIAMSSLKYTIVILRGMLFKIQHQHFGKWVILSHLHLFVPLLFDAAFQDLKNLYFQFKESMKQAIALSKDQQNHNQKFIKTATVQTLTTFIRTTKEFSPPKISNPQEVVIFLGQIIKQIFQLANSIKPEIKTINYDQESLALLSKLQIEIGNCVLPLPFAVAILKEYSSSHNIYTSPILSQPILHKILLQTVCLELTAELDSPPQSSGYNEYLLQFIPALTNYLHRANQQQSTLFISQNFNKIQELIEKVNILVGAIDPQSPTTKNIVSYFLPLSFLSPLSKERILAKLIQKHNNLAFKAHLIAQYRKLLTFKTSKTIWIRSIDLLFQELKNVQPNTNIDYVGHILSFAYFWQRITLKFLEDSSFTKKLPLNIGKLLQQFQQTLKSIKKGLEAKQQLCEQGDKQLQRNEINLCLFRIQQMVQFFQSQNNKGQ